MTTLGVTGATRGAGASTLAANLAAAAALAGNDTLLWPLERGDAVTATTLPNLSVVGGTDDPFAGFLARRRAARLEAALLAAHRLLVLDAPAGVAGERAGFLARADAVIIAVDPGDVAAFATAVERLGTARGPVLPVLAALDRRDPVHAAAQTENPGWPVVPLGAIDPLGAVPRLLSPHSPATAAVWLLWDAIAPRLGLAR